MAIPIHAQSHALDRLMYTLEEQSFARICEEDKQFEVFLSDIYDQIARKQASLG